MKTLQEYKHVTVILVSLFCTLFSGCASMGPGTIGRDRINYDQAITQSWQRQLLLNLVKIRYGDTPVFLDVSSITNSYGVETQVNLTASWWWNLDRAGDQALGGLTRYTDKPTITYSPLLGQRFTRSLMTPISPGVVLSLMQSGWAADAVLRMMVSSINGVQNRFAAGARARGADPEFYRLGTALRRIQASGAMGMRIEKLKEQEWSMMTLARDKTSESAAQDQQIVREILNLKPGVDEYRVVFGSARRNEDEIAMITRTMLEMLFDLSATIEVPQADVQDGRTLATRVFESDGPGGFRPMLRIVSGLQRPQDEFVAVQYRDHWFWVEDRDYPSKQLLSFVLILLSLTDVDPGKGSPIITIPAN